MRIATFNVNGVNGRLPVLLRWLQETAPDVVCLQELKAAGERFPQTEIAEAGYHAIWAGQKSWNGVAILTREAAPIEVLRRLPGDEHDAQARYLEAAVDGLLIACLYAPNGNPSPGPKFDYKLEWLARLAERANYLLAHKAPALLVGDFNVIPTELDVYKPERWTDDALFAPEARAAFAQLLKGGWVDAVRECFQGERVYTFWDYFRDAYGRNAGLRLDHLLLSPLVAPRLVDAGVDAHVSGWPKASDHAPTWVELGQAQRRRTRSKNTPTTKRAASR